ncbi:MAG TPA: class I SAM-dependent methyltransferase [Parcubacteria group bacterium]|jgi:ubiquinone/menaquinone biosynthesis C-methylase UbiE|nr:class I SAM-dependent methyltransferase [Parcubacteria group bacterium]
MTDKYYKSRYVWNEDRTVVWKEIVRYLEKYIPKDGTILDIGAGYCDFINNVDSKNRIALDYSPDLNKYAKEEIIQINSSVTDMSKVVSNTVDVVFASNLFEHLTDAELETTMGEVKRVLKKDGRLILMQPNYRLAYKTYFDDHTHKKVFSDTSLETFLLSHDMEIELKKAKFLPFSLKSRPSIIPVFPMLIRAYINSPWKPFAGQMLFVSKKI